MTTKVKSAVPQWLRDSLNDNHIHTVLRTLTKRERERRTLQETSRRPAENVLPSVIHHSIAIGAHPSRKLMNRYGDVFPYDRTRVISTSGRYLNASWVRERAGRKLWIATQAPLPETAHAFLSLLFPDSNIQPSPPRVIITLTRHKERGMRKADAYFPDVAGKTWNLDEQEQPRLKVTLIAQEEIAEAACVRSTVSVTRESDGQAIEFSHFFYTAWPDMGVPRYEDQATLLKFIKLADREMMEKGGGPGIVGCSAGIGRTGSYIALNSLLRSYSLLPSPPLQLELETSPEGSLPPVPANLAHDEVFLEIDWLRDQRPGMVQRGEQAVLIYQVLETAFLEQSQAEH